MIQKRKLTGSPFNEEISLLGMGGMRLPTLSDENKKIDPVAAADVIQLAYESGINYFDTAFTYHGGKGEEFFGSVLSQYPRESYYLATKIPSWLMSGPEDVEKTFFQQLKNCRVEYFDFYLVHNMGESKIPALDSLGLYDFLIRQKEQGRIRHLGFSFHDSPAVLQTIVDRYDWDFAQIQFNYLDWELQNAQKQYQILEQAELPVIVMEPLRGGALVQLCPEAIAILQQANPYISPADWGLRFAASFPRVLTVLSGMSSREQVFENVRTLSAFRPLSHSELATLRQALAAYRQSASIPCTGCRYCMDCPSGVDIPRLIGIYNEYLRSGSGNQFLAHTHNLGKASQPENCVSCGACLEKCPQKVPIPDLMHKMCELNKTLERPNWLG